MRVVSWDDIKAVLPDGTVISGPHGSTDTTGLLDLTSTAAELDLTCYPQQVNRHERRKRAALARRKVTSNPARMHR